MDAGNVGNRTCFVGLRYMAGTCSCRCWGSSTDLGRHRSLRVDSVISNVTVKLCRSVQDGRSYDRGNDVVAAAWRVAWCSWRIRLATFDCMNWNITEISRRYWEDLKYGLSDLLARFELVFSLVLPNLVWAKVAVVNVSGAWDLGKNELAGAGLVVSVALKVGLGADVGGEPCGEVFGLRLSALRFVLTASIGRKHCASGLNVFVTSRSADESSWWSFDSEYRICKTLQASVKHYHDFNQNAAIKLLKITGLVLKTLFSNFDFNTNFWNYLHCSFFADSVRHLTGIHPNGQLSGEILQNVSDRDTTLACRPI